jgi:hypothetical protein
MRTAWTIWSLRWPSGFACREYSSDRRWCPGDGRYKCGGCGSRTPERKGTGRASRAKRGNARCGRFAGPVKWRPRFVLFSAVRQCGNLRRRCNTLS